tara:strand:- start:66 stop:239 length:174 start_codon:yes stop_codon:yes gene_type:complete
MKTYKITLAYDVQKTYFVKASSKQYAQNKLDDFDKWEKDIETSAGDESWEYRDICSD